MKRVTLVVVVVALAILALNLFHNIGGLQAKEEISSATIMNKLQEVIENQKTIIKKLDEMKEELYIIKIRSSRR